MDSSEILRTIASLNRRSEQAEHTATKHKQELAATRQSLARVTNELEETVRLAELLYEVNQKLGVVTDFLLKQQGAIDLKDCKSFETIFGLLVKQAEVHAEFHAESHEGSHEESHEESGAGAVDESIVRSGKSEDGQKHVVGTLHSR